MLHALVETICYSNCLNCLTLGLQDTLLYIQSNLKIKHMIELAVIHLMDGESILIVWDLN